MYLCVAGSAVEAEEAGMEVPEAVTVEVKEVHPMPEVSLNYITHNS